MWGAKEANERSCLDNRLELDFELELCVWL